MLPKMQTFHEPETIDEALALLARPDVRTLPLYGGPELFDDLGVAAEVEAVVSLEGLGLDAVTELRVGAMVPLSSLPKGALLAAAERSYSLNLRNIWTVGAVVVHGGASLPLLVTLLALDAQVEIAREGEAPITDYLPRRALTDLVIGVVLPGGTKDQESAKMAYEAVARTPSDEPIVCAVARVVTADEKVASVALALGGVAQTAIRAGDVEAALTGKPATTESIEAALGALDALEPPADFRGSSEYRREMAKVTARRALLRALERR
jgi:CO/xanthine dehydrogenase FAD-binding subunit